MKARAAKLRAVEPVAKPPLVNAGPSRAMRVYPDSIDNACKWMAAVKWMQRRRGGSIWLLDRDSIAKWRGMPVEGERA